MTPPRPPRHIFGVNAFSYLSVLLSIILGLAITQVLLGYRGLLLSRARVTLYAPPLIWSGLVLLVATQLWWASFGLADHETWTFATFGVVLLQTVLLYLCAALVLPDFPADKAVNLRDHYFREVTPLFGLLIATLAVSLLKDWMLDGSLPDAANVAFHLVFFMVAILAIAIHKPGFHLALAPTMATLFLIYIGLLFFRL